MKRPQDVIGDKKPRAASLNFACRGMELDNPEFRLASLEEHAEKNEQV